MSEKREYLSITATCYSFESFTELEAYARENYKGVIFELHNYAPVYQVVIKDSNVEYITRIYKDLHSKDVDVALRNYKF